MFIETIGELRDGFALPEIDEKLKEVIAAVRATGKAGALQITLKIIPQSGGECPVLSIEDIIKPVVPEPNREKSLFYATKENDLSKRDPRQQELPGLRVVNMEASAQ